jgi:hypothetical protein
MSEWKDCGRGELPEPHLCETCLEGYLYMKGGNNIGESTVHGDQFPCGVWNSGVYGAWDGVGVDGFVMQDNGGGFNVIRCPAYSSAKKLIHDEYMKTDTWKKKRFERLQKDNFRCVMCGTAYNLCVHHISYKNLGNESMDDLITLCERCHKKVHETDLTRE